MRHVNDAALKLIQRDEGLRLDAYRDVAGVWTIGYGHTPAYPGQRITEAEAVELLRDDLAHAEAAVQAATHDVPTTDGQFSAMVSLAFNIGTGAFRQSTVLRKHRDRDYVGAAAAFLFWDKAHVGGRLVIMPGLERRRREERALYLSDCLKPQPALHPVAAEPAPKPVAVAAPKRPPLWSRILAWFGA